MNDDSSFQISIAQQSKSFFLKISKFREDFLRKKVESNLKNISVLPHQNCQRWRKYLGSI